MPTITVPADATNYSLLNRLQTLTPDPHATLVGFGRVRLISDGDGLKVGGSDMTSSNYDYMLNTEQNQDEGQIMLQERFVRNDSGAPITLHIHVRST